MEKINWENGELIKEAFVEIDGVEYEVTPEEVEGTTPLDADNLNLMQDNIEEAIEDLKRQKILWSGDWMMSDQATATLSETVSSQKNGIVLVWSKWEDGGSRDVDFSCFFIPKIQVSLHPGKGIVNIMGNVTVADFSIKYVYVHNNKIVGNANNAQNKSSTAMGFKCNNRSFCLRYVIGV